MTRLSRIVLATNNAKKLAELRRITEAHGIEVVALSDVVSAEPPAETERTFEGNARIKARAAAEASGLPALADDSGLEIDELNQMPGVRSARWAGPDSDDNRNLQLVLAQLEGVPAERRGARFVCALAYVDPQGETHTWRGEWAGSIVEAPRGANGFGYDPIFQPEGETRTSAQLSAAEKDAASHRGRALAQFEAWLQQA